MARNDLRPLIERLYLAHIPLTVQTTNLSGDASGRLSLRVPRNKKKSAQNILGELEDDMRTLATTADLRNDTQRTLTLYRFLLDLFPKDEQALSYIRAQTGA